MCLNEYALSNIDSVLNYLLPVGKHEGHGTAIKARKRCYKNLVHSASIPVQVFGLTLQILQGERARHNITGGICQTLRASGDASKEQ